MASPAVPKFDMGTINPEVSPSKKAAQDRQYLAEGDGFTLNFTLPFVRADVYAELISPQQLGVDHQNVKISITRRTKAAQDALERQLTESARSKKPQAEKEKEQDDAKAALSVGCERTVEFPDGVVVSELVELVPPQLIRWCQTDTRRQTNMIGKPGGPLPEVTIRLDDMGDQGTGVSMTYDFYKIIKSDGTELEGSMMSSLLAQATKGWATDMGKRGYSPCAGLEVLTGRLGFGSPAAPGSGGPESTVLRSARRMEADLKEEEEMKRMMMERAAAASK